jgi:hypothetical protein
VEDLEPSQLARALVGLLDWAESAAPDEQQDVLGERLRQHMGGEARGLPVVSRPLEGYQRANFQVAVDAYLEATDRHAELIGLPMMHGYRVGLAELVKGLGRSPWGDGMDDAAPIEYEPVEVGERRIMCVAAGLWLITGEGEPLLLMLRRTDHGPGHAELGIEIMARQRETAEALVEELERLMGELNVYRRRILVLSSSRWADWEWRYTACPRSRASRSSFPAACSNESSDTPRSSASMPTLFAPPAAT